MNVSAEQFASLIHAYGFATDTPGHLAALRDGDDDARAAAMEHLWSAVIHQGTPGTATPPAATAIAELLVNEPPSDAGLRAELLEFLAAVAEAARPHGHSQADLVTLAHPERRDVDAEVAAFAAAGDDEGLWEDSVLVQALYARSVLGCAEVVPRLLSAATALLDDRNPRVRSMAAYAATECCRVLGESPGSLVEKLATLAASAEPDERAAHVLALGELGLAPREYLHDPHPGVRACAALAPSLAQDEAATAEILAALADPAACDDWFRNPPPQVGGGIRFTLVAAIIERVKDFSRLLPAAVAIARIATKYTVNFDWGPLLLAAFPDGALPDRLSDSQRRYLGALVDNPDLWDPRFGNAFLIFKQAGLPYDRDACRALLMRRDT